LDDEVESLSLFDIEHATGSSTVSADEAEKDLGRLDPPIRRRIVAAVDRLAAGDAAGVVRAISRCCGCG
jgi:hypothetical protein